MENKASLLDQNFTLFGFGRPAQEAKMAAQALAANRFIFTTRWGKDDSFRVAVYREMRKLRRAYGVQVISSVRITPNLICVGRGLTVSAAKGNLAAYLTPERMNDLAANAEARYRPASRTTAREGNDADENEGAAEV